MRSRLRSLSARKRCLFVTMSLVLVAGLAETAARAIDALTDVSVTQLREDFLLRRGYRLGHYWPAQRGDYPYLPYVPNPEDARVNELGFRGQSFQAEKPAGVYRIACLGGSTTWDEYPSRLQEQLEDDFAKQGLKLEVINAGDVLWTSMETLVNFVTRVLPLKPDAVVIYHGANDGIPAFGERTSWDYTHWRGRLERNEPTVWDRMPRFLDHSAAYVGLRRVFDRATLTLGWNEMTTHYDVNFQKHPYQGVAPYRNNIFSLISLARARGIEVFLSTFVFNPDFKFNYSHKPWQDAVEEINEITRSFAGRWEDVHVIDTAAALPGGNDWQIDFCHFTPAGKVKLARFLAEHIRPTIPDLLRKQADPMDIAAHLPPRRSAIATGGSPSPR